MLHLVSSASFLSPCFVETTFWKLNYTDLANTLIERESERGESVCECVCVVVCERVRACVWVSALAR